MAEIRKTQDTVEIAFQNNASVRKTQDTVEVAYQQSVNTRQSQSVIEIVQQFPAAMRLTQDIVEIMYQLPDLSGIYFINPNILHDTYYIADKKIPDPTIRTALMGE